MKDDPTNWTTTEWLLVTGVAITASLINWIQNVRNNDPRAFRLLEVIGELATSGFVTFLTFSFLAGLGVNVGLSVGIAGITAHLSTRLLFAVDNAVLNKITQKIDEL